MLLIILIFCLNCVSLFCLEIDLSTSPQFSSNYSSPLLPYVSANQKHANKYSPSISPANSSGNSIDLCNANSLSLSPFLILKAPDMKSFIELKYLSDSCIHTLNQLSHETIQNFIADVILHLQKNNNFYFEGYNSLVEICNEGEHKTYAEVIKKWVKDKEINIKLDDLCLCHILHHSSFSLIDWTAAMPYEFTVVNAYMAEDLVDKAKKNIKSISKQTELKFSNEKLDLVSLMTICKNYDHTIFNDICSNWLSKYNIFYNNFCLCKLPELLEKKYVKPVEILDQYYKEKQCCDCSSCIIL